jgi:hypothetical protein
MPQARGLEGPLEIAIDLAERYPWRFAGHEVSVKRRGLPVGDYAIVRDDIVIAAVERKTAADFANAAVAGQLNLAPRDLGKTPHAALVIEGRPSDVIRAARNGGAKSGWILNVLTALQISQPTVIVDVRGNPAARSGVDVPMAGGREPSGAFAGAAGCDRPRSARAADRTSVWAKCSGRGFAARRARARSVIRNFLDASERGGALSRHPGDGRRGSKASSDRRRVACRRNRPERTYVAGTASLTLPR